MATESVVRRGLQNITGIAVAYGHEIGMRMHAALRDASAARRIENNCWSILRYRRAFPAEWIAAQFLDIDAGYRSRLDFFNFVPQIGFRNQQNRFCAVDNRVDL